MRKAPILVISKRYGREISTALEQCGRGVILADAAAEAGRAYRDSNAFIALVDARGALETGLLKAEELNPQVEERRGALLVLLSRADYRALDRVYDAGATHYLVSPFGSDQLEIALKFAERAIRRMRASGTEAALAHAQDYLSRTPRWRWEIGSPTVILNDDLVDMVDRAFGRHEIRVVDAFRRLPSEEIRRVRRTLRLLLDAGVAGSVDHSIQLDDRRARLVHHIQPVYDQSRELIGLTATVEDILESANQRRLSAHYDPLTGLASLNNARARIDEALTDNRDPQIGAVAILIGISRFDQVNASFGRQVADRLLQAVARRLRRLIEERGLEDTLAARLGGAEFAVVFFGPIQLSRGVFFSQLAAKIFEKPFIIEGRSIHLASRVGIAASDASMTSADELLQAASSALSSARELGPNAFQVYLSGAANDPVRLASLEESVRSAMQGGKLDLAYQPQVNASNNRIVGVEALLRFEHPVYGPLAAETLLSTAERGEFAVEFGRAILRQALTDACNWPEELSELRLSVNVTAADMHDPEFVANLLQALEQSGFPASRLTLEITEGALVEDLKRTADMLSSLRERRIRAAIDDFGTGYSSLAYLKALPLDYLKIDKQIASDITGETRDKIIVRGVVDMARSLGMTVIAEGVETEAQLDLLIRAGCNAYQGFLCAGALTSADLPNFISRWNQTARESVS